MISVWRHLSPKGAHIAQLYDGIISDPLKMHRDLVAILAPFGAGLATPLFTDYCIFFLLLNLDNKKFQGADNIPNAYLKQYAKWCSRIFSFTRSLSDAAVSGQWKAARVISLTNRGMRYHLKTLSLCHCYRHRLRLLNTLCASIYLVLEKPTNSSSMASTVSDAAFQQLRSWLKLRIILLKF